MLICPVSLIFWLTGTGSAFFALYHLVLYGLSAFGISLLTGFSKQNPFKWLWFAYAPLFILVGTSCGWVGFMKKEMVWADICYRFNGKGEVLSLKRRNLGTDDDDAYFNAPSREKHP